MQRANIHRFSWFVMRGSRFCIRYCKALWNSPDEKEWKNTPSNNIGLYIHRYMQCKMRDLCIRYGIKINNRIPRAQIVSHLDTYKYFLYRMKCVKWKDVCTVCAVFVMKEAEAEDHRASYYKYFRVWFEVMWLMSAQAGRKPCSHDLFGEIPVWKYMYI